MLLCCADDTDLEAKTLAQSHFEPDFNFSFPFYNVSSNLGLLCLQKQHGFFPVAAKHLPLCWHPSQPGYCAFLKSRTPEIGHIRSLSIRKVLV